MRFVHFGDTHLGATNFKINERRQDFYKAFNQVIDYCISKKPDFVVHTGDLFDTGKPDNETLIFTIDELKRLKQAGIPLFIISGSHDVSVDGTFLTVLERVGLLTNVSNPRYYNDEGDSTIVNGESINGAFICGVYGRRGNVKEVYEQLRINKPEGEFGVFLFHHIVSDVMGTELFADLPKSLLPKGLDYYAGGHWHDYASLSVHEKPLIYSGSTEHHNIESMERNNERGFIYYDGEPRFIKLDSREVNVVTIKCDGLSPGEALKACLKNVEEPGRGIIVLRLEGELRGGLKSEIDKSRIKNECLKAGYSHCELRLNNLSNPGKALISPKSTQEELEFEYLTKQGYSADEVSRALRFIKILGESLKGEELSKAVGEAYKLL